MRQPVSAENFVVKSLVIRIYHQTFFGRSNQEERIGRAMYANGERRDVYRFFVGNYKGKTLLVDSDFYKRLILF